MNTVFSFKLEDFLCTLPVVLIFLGSILPLSMKVLRNNKEPNSFVAMVYSLIGVVSAIGVTLALYHQKSTSYYAFSNSLIFDGVSILATLAIAIITIFTAVMARENFATNGRQYSEFLFLLLNAAGGMMILSWSNDLIVTFIAIEVMSLCLYLLVALSHEERLSKEAAFKYFVLGSFASAIFLYGVAFIYGVSGTTFMNLIADATREYGAENKLFIMGVGFVLVGFCFKVAIVPFHSWAPDVYQGAPTPVTAFMATGVKLVAFVAFLRFIRLGFLVTLANGEMVNVMQWLAVLTMVAGNIAAIMQNNLKRMLAYSSVAHSGYVLIGIIAAGVGGESWRGDLSVIYYLLAYTVMTLGAFAVVSILEKNENDIILVDDLKGLATRNPWTAMLFALFMLSLAGIPPTVGFFGKFFIFSAAIKQGLFWLAVWGAISSIISVYYYLRPIVYMYMKDENGSQVVNNTRISHGVAIFMGFLVIGFGLATEPIYKIVKAAIDSLL